MVSGHNGGGDIAHPTEDFVVRILKPTESVLLEVKGNQAVDFQKRTDPIEATTLRIDMTKFREPCARIWEIEVYQVKE